VRQRRMGFKLMSESVPYLAAGAMPRHAWKCVVSTDRSARRASSMSRKPKRPKHKSTVLLDHKKLGSRFVPPVLAQIRFAELSYVRDLLPEITWIALANQRLGYHDGAKLCTETATIAKRCWKHERFLNFALLRSYRQLDPPGVTELVSELDRAGLLPNLPAVVEPLVGLFPTCPMTVVGMPAAPRDRASLVNDLRNCVGGLLDRWSLPASAAQATVVYISSLTGGLIYHDSVERPDLEAIVASPGTDAAEHAAALVRATVLHTIMPSDEGASDSWAREFWNAALHVDDCTD
jgi:hypothetical protein